MLDDILKRRALATEPDLRFFLALLLNIEGRERIFDLLKQRFPGSEPIDKVLDLVYELANSRIAGTERSNLLGLDDFGDLDLYVLEQILRGRSGNEIAEAFRLDFGSDPDTSQIAEKESVIRSALVFAPLMRDSALPGRTGLRES